MRVLLLSHTSELYGAARSLQTLAKGLHSHDHELLIGIPGPGPLSMALQAVGIDTTVLRAPWWVVAPRASLKSRQWYLRQIVGASQQVVHAIRRFQPDLVHSNSAVIPAGALAARRMGVPHIWHLREQVIEHFNDRFILGRALSLRLMGMSSAALIPISRAVMKAYTAPATVRKLHLVYNGVDIPASMAASYPDWHTAALAEPVLALSGILHPAKGQDEAIRALGILHGRGLSCRLMLVGDDPIGFGATLRTMVEDLNLVDHVVFTGHLPNPLLTIEKAQIYLMCSRSEAFGRVTIEAMLLGKPVIGADTGGTPEIIEDGRTGLLYQQGDARSLADAIQRLLLDPGLAAALGRRARASAVALFSEERYVQGVEAVYRKVLTEGERIQK